MVRFVDYERGNAAAKLGYNLAILSADAMLVVGLRSRVIVKGGAAARREAMRMVAEKVEALAETQELLLGPGTRLDTMTLGEKIVEIYAKRVRANKTRLL